MPRTSALTPTARQIALAMAAPRIITRRLEVSAAQPQKLALRELARLLDAGLARLAETGRLDVIKASYGLSTSD